MSGLRRAGVEDGVVDVLDLGVGGGDDLAGLRVFVGCLDLVDHALVGGAGRVEPGLAGCVDVLLTDREVGVPVAREELSDGIRVGGHAGGFEQVGAVADRLGTDVGAVADEVAVGVGRSLDLPVEPAAREVGRHRREEVGVLHDLGQPVNLDGLDVGKTRLAQLLEVVRACVVRRGGDVVDDRDVRVLIHVLLKQRIGVTEVVEGRDGEGDRLVGVDGFRSPAAARAAGEDERGGAECCGDDRAATEGT